ncbi:MAG TPA: hypothetical protein VIG99_33050 [Myxococcaceae bacterium]|jgi:hypothetical protein
MRSLREPIERVLDHVRFFLGATEIRAMHVLTSAQLLPVVAWTIATCEGQEDSPSPMLVLATPGKGADRGWTARTQELLNEYGDLRDAARKAEVELPAVATPEQAGLAGFALALAEVLRGLQDPLREAILLLAPDGGARALSGDLGALLRLPSLASARWIAVDAGGELALPIRTLGGGTSLMVYAVPDVAPTPPSPGPSRRH